MRPQNFKGLTWWALAVSLVYLSAARGDDGDLAARARAVLRTHCSGCHSTDGKAKGGFDYVLDR